MSTVSEILSQSTFSRTDIVRLLSATDPDEVEAIRRTACEVLERTCGIKVYYRGLIEFSNRCVNNCAYCGIRAGNRQVRRYRLSEEEILRQALWCAAQGYGSVVLQSGECRDEDFISFVERVVRRIRTETVSSRLPRGVGITLCVGEQSRETYERFFAAGAHRYLLRIETSDPELYAKLHPPSQDFWARVACLRTLRAIGFQVGTGVMIGLPEQTVEHLAADVEFFRDMDVDMIGMGPYIPHAHTPLGVPGVSVIPPAAQRLELSLRMIAVCRIVLPDVNIAATTALQALVSDGRERGLLHGANIIMPLLTPTAVRKDYLLYDGKPCVDESADQCRACLARRIAAVGRAVAVDEWGDSPHARVRTRTGAGVPPPGKPRVENAG